MRTKLRRHKKIDKPQDAVSAAWVAGCVAGRKGAFEESEKEHKKEIYKLMQKKRAADISTAALLKTNDTLQRKVDKMVEQTKKMANLLQELDEKLKNSRTYGKFSILKKPTPLEMRVYGTFETCRNFTIPIRAWDARFVQNFAETTDPIAEAVSRSRDLSLELANYTAQTEMGRSIFGIDYADAETRTFASALRNIQGIRNAQAIIDTEASSRFEFEGTETGRFIENEAYPRDNTHEIGTPTSTRIADIVEEVQQNTTVVFEPREGDQRYGSDERGSYIETYEGYLGWSGRLYFREGTSIDWNATNSYREEQRGLEQAAIGIAEEHNRENITPETREVTTETRLPYHTLLEAYYAILEAYHNLLEGDRAEPEEASEDFSER